MGGCAGARVKKARFAGNGRETVRPGILGSEWVKVNGKKCGGN